MTLEYSDEHIPISTDVAVYTKQLGFQNVESTLELDKSSSTTTIINDSTSMIAIEAGARVRVYNDNGEEDFETLAENLIIIPSQMIIPQMVSKY